MPSEPSAVSDLTSSGYSKRLGFVALRPMGKHGEARNGDLVVAEDLF
jgi:hypothetical protein